MLRNPSPLSGQQMYTTYLGSRMLSFERIAGGNSRHVGGLYEDLDANSSLDTAMSVTAKL